MSRRREVLVDQDRMYALTKTRDGRLYLEVVIGGIAMENLVLPLDEEEMARYTEEGKTFLDGLAAKIARAPSGYRPRAV